MDEFTPPAFNIPNIHTVSPRISATTDRDVGDYMMEGTYVKFLERFLPASVVLNESNNVVHFFGDYQKFLSIAPGKATFNFFMMVNEDLSLVASTALNRCRSEHTAITYTGIAVDTEEGRGEIDLTVTPIDREVTAMNGRYYTLRIAPYRTTENSIRGLVITIIDSLGKK